MNINLLCCHILRPIAVRPYIGRLIIIKIIGLLYVQTAFNTIGIRLAFRNIQLLNL